MRRPRIFVCYCDKDTEWGAAFANHLMWECGFDISTVQSSSGTLMPPARVAQVEQEIERCEAFLVVLTPVAWEDRWIRKALRSAIDCRKRILGILREPIRLSGSMATYQVFDARDQTAYHAAFHVASILSEEALTIHNGGVQRSEEANVSASGSPASVVDVSGIWECVRQDDRTQRRPASGKAEPSAWVMRWTLKQDGERVTGEFVSGPAKLLTDGWKIHPKSIGTGSGTIAGQEVTLHVRYTKKTWWNEPDEQTESLILVGSDRLANPDQHFPPIYRQYRRVR